MSKALVLMSGGLDSMLSARILMEQGVEVTGLVFISNFFGAAKARKAAKQLGIDLREVEFKKEHLEMVKNPKYGYGKNMNPCIDCHALMIRHAKKIMEDGGYDFVATGEILGQRPMSQNKNSLNIVVQYSGIGNKLVRPMSAKLLDETEPEREGKVIRGRLLDISGRSRVRQRELVKKFGIKEYSSPGGGCLLTDPVFAERLVILFDYWPECRDSDIELLKNGRVFWLALKNNGNISKVMVVIGRNKEDCGSLTELAQAGDILMELKDEVGPTALIRIKNNELKITNEDMEINVPKELKKSELKLGEEKSFEEILNIASLLAGHYAPKARGKKVSIKLNNIK